MMMVLPLLLAGLTVGQTTDDQKAIQGVWKIVALIENGRSLSENEILQDHSADGLLTVEGNTVSIMPPGATARRKMVFLVDPKATPKTIDLAGAKKVGSKGIYSLSGDSLIICLSTSTETTRPTGFTASEKSNQVMMALERVKISTSKPAKPVPPPQPAPVLTNDKMKQLLTGTWGHSTDFSKNYITFNADGTFSALIDYTRGLKRVFNPTIRSSGSWRLVDGVVIVTITSSTDSARRGQVYSYRISRISDRDVIAVDQEGRTRREWRVR